MEGEQKEGKKKILESLEQSLVKNLVKMRENKRGLTN